MTENEAIKVLTDKNTDISTSKCDDVAWRRLQPAINVAITALEEIQQYRELGSVQFIKDELRNYEYLIQSQRLNAESDIKELNEYRALGTAEELREAREKQILKKPEEINDDYSYYVCPACGEAIYSTDSLEEHHYCLNCGQSIDWSTEQ